MNDDNFILETEAYAALSELMEEAKRTKELFDRASLPVPAPLSRMLGAGGSGGKELNAAVKIPPMKGPTRPRSAGNDWVWISVEEAQTQTLVRAVLREAGAPIRPKAIVDRISGLRPELGSGGVYNTGPRLLGLDLISKKDGFWELSDMNSGPVLQGKAIWGSSGDLLMQEIAAHRRMIIVHLLELYKGGLQVVQIVERLSEFPGCKAPVSKDLVKADMTVLAKKKKAKRTGNSKKWIAIKGGVPDVV